MSEESKGWRWIVAFARVLWHVKVIVVLVTVTISALSTTSYLVLTDYLDHRKDRAEAIELAHSFIKNKEETLGALFDQTTPLWQRGEPIPPDLVEKLALATSELYAAIDRLSSPTDRASKASHEFRDAVAHLRNSVVSYRHDEETVRALHSAIDVYAKSRDAFYYVVEGQIEDYSKTLVSFF